MNISELFPGCEFFLEDTQSEPSDAEKHEMTLEMMDEYHNVEMDSVNTEKLLSNLDDLTSMFYHVRSFGVDRSFLSLANRDNRLGKYLQLQLPSCESFDAIGNPNSHISIVAMEGLWDGIKRIAAKIRDIIKAIIHWIATKLKQFINWIGSWFKSSSEKIKIIKLGIRKVKDGSIVHVVGSDKDFAKFNLKSLGKHAFDAVEPITNKLKEATSIISKEYTKDDPARFLQTADGLRNFMTTSARSVSTDKISIDFSKLAITGKNVDYDFNAWCDSYIKAVDKLPELKKAIDAIVPVLEAAAKKADSVWAKVWAFIGKTDVRELAHGKSTPVEMLNERTKAVNKFRNSIVLAITKITNSYMTAIDSASETFTKIINAAEANKDGLKVDDGKSNVESASQELSNK